MPSCTVLQPNGKYAVWSTIVDDFLLLNATEEEVVAYEVQHSNRMSDYPGGEKALAEDVRREFGHIRESGISWDWSPDWNSCINHLIVYKKTESLQEIVESGIPLKMKRKISSLKRERYWHSYWRNKSFSLQCKLMSMGAEPE